MKKRWHKFQIVFTFDEVGEGIGSIGNQTKKRGLLKLEIEWLFNDLIFYS
jgi:hypothetical protein